MSDSQRWEGEHPLPWSPAFERIVGQERYFLGIFKEIKEGHVLDESVRVGGKLGGRISNGQTSPLGQGRSKELHP